MTTFGVNPQHTGLSAVASQPMEAIHWSTPVENLTASTYQHHGGPVITDNNTVVYPYRTGTGESPPNFRVVARNGNDGAPVWDVPTDWVPTGYSWYPPMQPAFVAATNRLYYPGLGGTIYYRDNVDSPTGSVTQLAFWGSLTDYLNSKSTYDSKVFIESSITPDNQGNIYFGFRTTGTTPAGLTSGIARITPAGVGTWVSAQVAAGGDTNINWVHRYGSFALSNDESTLYVPVRDADTSYYGRLVGLNATTLSTQYISGVLKDPRDGGANNASLSSSSTSAPMVAPDGKVFYGVLPSGGSSRGWMLQFSPNLQTLYTPGGFGWDNTASVVPAAMVPQYTGSSSYLIFTKYNNYYQGGGADGNDGSNRIAVLDPNDTEAEFHTSSKGQLVMKRVLSKLGPTQDWLVPGVPTAVREWCINYATVDPMSSSILVNSSDGKFYRWHLPSDTLIEPIQLTAGELQPYTMTIVGVDGTVYGIQIGKLFAFGKTPGLSVSDPVISEGTGGTVNATFTVSLDFPRTEAITVNYATADDTAKAGLDYTTKSGTLTFNPGEKSKTVTVAITTDVLNEIDEGFFLNLSSPNNAVIVDGQGRATIQNDDPLPLLSIADLSANETNGGTTTFNFTVTLTPASGRAVTVNFGTADGTAKIGDNDYQLASGSLTFDPGETSKTVSVIITGDTTFEPGETFVVNLSGPVNSTISDNQALGTITNDDGVPSITITDEAVVEGKSATFTVKLSNASSQTITLDYATAGASANGLDFQAASGQLTFNPGETARPIVINTTDDLLNELSENFHVNLANPTNGFVADGQGKASIQDNDPEPTVSIGDATINEGAGGTTTITFLASLSAASGRSVTVNYATADGSAKLANNDYQLASGSVTFNEGETSKLIAVVVNGDMVVEPDEDFFVDLSGPNGAALGDSQGRGIISNDDSRLLSINDQSVTEGNGGSATVTMTIVMSLTSAQDVTVNIATADGTAKLSDGDFAAAAETITFKAGETSKPVFIVINGDAMNEADEVFHIVLSNPDGATIGDGQGEVTILNDDAVPDLVVVDVNVPEGDYGTGYVNVYITLAAGSGQTVTVDYETLDGTAVSTGLNPDYGSTKGTLTFLAGETVKSLQIPLLGDYIDELNESLIVRFSKAVNGGLPDNELKVTLVDEDTSYLAISNKTVLEGNGGTTAVQLTLSLSVPSDRTVTIEYNTADATAVQPGDYQFAADVVSFDPGQTAKIITVSVQGDTVDELDEMFCVELYNPTGGAVIGNYEAMVTILDDDPGTPPRVDSVTVNDGSAQRSRVTSVAVRFDQFVTLPANAADAFQLKRQGDGAAVTLNASVDNTGAGTVVTLTFGAGPVESKSLADGRYTLTVLAAQVLGFDGNGDGTPGDDHVLVGNPATNRLFRLFGDADGDNDVDTSDFGAFRAVFGGASTIFDFDNDGDVDTGDFGAFRGRFGASI